MAETTDRATELPPATRPDGISDDHIRPLAGWRRHASPLSLVVFATVVALAFLGIFGHERNWAADGVGASLDVHMPEVIRNGEFFEMRVTVVAEAEVDELVIEVDHSLWQDITVNTVLPAPSEEASVDGRYRLTFADLPAGTTFLLKVDGQVNPDIVGGNDGSVTVRDGDDLLAEVAVSMGVLP